MKRPMTVDGQTKTWTSLPAMFFDQANRHGEEPFLSAKKDGNWHHLSWNEVAKKIARLAEGLTALGIKTGDRVAILSLRSSSEEGAKKAEMNRFRSARRAAVSPLIALAEACFLIKSRTLSLAFI